MKTEEFDDAFRQKLQGLSSPVTEAEVDAVHQYVNSKRSSFSFNRILAYSAIAATIVLITGLIFWNIRLSKGQDELTKTIKELNNKLDNTLAQKQEQQTENTGKINPQVITENRSPVPVQKENNIRNQEQATPANIVTNTTGNNNNKIPVVVIHPEDSSTTKSTNDKPATEVVNEEQIPVAKSSDSAAFAVSIPDTNNETNNAVSSSVKTRSIRKKVFPKIALGFSTGVGLEAGHHGMAYSLIEEVHVMKHFSLNTGLKLLVEPHERYERPNDFYHDKHVAFKDRYEHHPIDTDDLHNIDIQCRYYQIPVSLNFKAALKKNIGLIISTGTNLTLNTIDRVNYQNRRPQQGNSETPTTIVDKNPKTSFHDINLSVGIQKNWGHFSADISPNFGIIMEKNADNSYPKFGSIKLRVMYRI